MRRTHSSNVNGLRHRGHGLQRFNPISHTGLRFSGREALRMAAVATFLMAFGLSTFLISASGDDVPLLTGFVRTNSANCLICFTNCNDTNFDYFVQSSTNLVDWVSAPAMQGAITNTTMISTVATLGQQSFHRVVKKVHTNSPYFNLGIFAVTNIHLNGSNVVVDTYNPSGTNDSGWYNPTNRIHGGPGTNVFLGTNVFSDPVVGNSNIVGAIHTTNGGHWNFHYDEALPPVGQ